MPRSARPARRGTRSAALLTVLAAVATALAACSPPGQPGPRDPTYAELGQQALHTLEHGYYAGGGSGTPACRTSAAPATWTGAVDSLTYALYFHWSLTHDPGVRLRVPTTPASGSGPCHRLHKRHAHRLRDTRCSPGICRELPSVSGAAIGSRWEG
jgi:hypothetical protein